MNPRSLAITTLALGLFTASAPAAFHFMQIEELIGGVNGNTNAQVIQLRQRFAGQNEVASTSLYAYDAAGNNPVLLLTIPTRVANGNGGDRILIASSAFNTLMSGVPGYNADFTLANTIPASYLTGGKVSFGFGGTNAIWSVAFGNYTGSNLGDFNNDDDFGAPFAGPLPSSSRQGIRFAGAADADSNSSFADYSLTPNPATVTNNDRETFTVVPEPTSILALGAAALGGVIFIRRRRH